MSIADAVETIETIVIDESDSDVRAALELCGMAGHAAAILDAEKDHTQKLCRDLIARVTTSLELFHDLPKLAKDNLACANGFLEHFAASFHNCTTDEDRRRVVQFTIDEIRWWTKHEPGESAAAAVKAALAAMPRKGGRPRREETGRPGKPEAVAKVMIAFGLIAGLRKYYSVDKAE